ncbi:MAG: hypothetical protein ACHQQQ_15270 [Bacteroidota bacterium]
MEIVHWTFDVEIDTFSHSISLGSYGTIFIGGNVKKRFMNSMSKLFHSATKTIVFLKIISGKNMINGITDLEEKQLLLGQLMTSFSYLEVSLQLALAAILSIDDAAGIRRAAGKKFSELSKSARVNGLNKLKNEEMKEDFIKIIELMMQCSKIRNEYIHAFYSYDYKSCSLKKLYINKRSFNSKKLPEPKEVISADIKALCQKIIDTTGMFNRFVKKNFQTR